MLGVAAVLIGATASVPAARQSRFGGAENGQVLQAVRAHAGPVHGVAIGPDDRRPASAGSDNGVCVWHAEQERDFFTHMRLQNSEAMHAGALG